MFQALLRDDVLLLLAAPCVGSFLGLLVARLPAGDGVLWGRSRCDHCGRRLGPLELLPIFGWLFTRGRCRACGGAVPLLYLAIELAALLVAAWSLAVLPGWLVWASCGLGWTLIALAVIDWRHLILPDELTLPLLPAGLAVAWVSEPGRLVEHAVAALGGGLFILAVALLYRRLRGREGIGLGDAKLMAAAGAWVSWSGLPSVLLLAAAAGLAGSLLRSRLVSGANLSEPVAFGSYIAAAFWLVWLYGPLEFG
jgi:leader peptidase (prepilin peptidase)/N-methyltransferase